MNNKFLQFIGLCKKAGKILEGYNRCEEYVTKDKVKLIIISEDCSINTRDKFIGYCNKKEVPYINGLTKEDLGNAVGRVEINILGVTDKNMSERLLVLWNENSNN
jgi:ribosomal protein L7Ae-like RNA K-turn-binding protein